jgi:hypothetical protein
MAHGSGGARLAAVLGTWVGGNGKVGDGASRFSIDSTARLVDRRRRAVRRGRRVKVTRFMSEVSVQGKGGRRDVQCLL